MSPPAKRIRTEDFKSSMNSPSPFNFGHMSSAPRSFSAFTPAHFPVHNPVSDIAFSSARGNIRAGRNNLNRNGKTPSRRTRSGVMQRRILTAPTQFVADPEIPAIPSRSENGRMEGKSDDIKTRHGAVFGKEFTSTFDSRTQQTITPLSSFNTSVLQQSDSDLHVPRETLQITTNFGHGDVDTVNDMSYVPTECNGLHNHHKPSYWNSFEIYEDEDEDESFYHGDTFEDGIMDSTNDEVQQAGDNKENAIFGHCFMPHPDFDGCGSRYLGYTECGPIGEIIQSRELTESPNTARLRKHFDEMMKAKRSASYKDA